MRSIFFLLTLLATLSWSTAAHAAPVGLADMDGDGQITLNDIPPFELALTQPEVYVIQFSTLTDWQTRGDINEDGRFDNFDLQPFAQVILDNTTGQIPEPPGVVLAGIAAAGLVVLRKKLRQPVVHRRGALRCRNLRALAQQSSPLGS